MSVKRSFDTHIISYNKNISNLEDIMGKYCFGIDVGGTSVKCGLFQTDGVLVEKWEIPTRKENSGEAILPDIAKTILDKIAERKLDKSDVDGVGTC